MSVPLEWTGVLRSASMCRAATTAHADRATDSPVTDTAALVRKNSLLGTVCAYGDSTTLQILMSVLKAVIAVLKIAPIPLGPTTAAVELGSSSMQMATHVTVGHG